MDNEVRKTLNLIQNKGALVNGEPTSRTFNNTTDSLEQVSDNVGQQDVAATADDLSDVTTTSAMAKLRRALLRLSSDAFTATIQGAARTELDTMLAQLATYLSSGGAAYSATVDPGGSARTNIEQTLEDIGQMFAGASGITTWPAAASPANGVSFAEGLRETYNDVNTNKQSIHGLPIPVQATFTGSLSNVGTAVVLALDAIGGIMREVRTSMFVSGAPALLGITPHWFVTRNSGLATFTEQTVPSLGGQHAPAGAFVENYLVGDLSEGLQGELRIDSNGNDSGLTYEVNVIYEN